MGHYPQMIAATDSVEAVPRRIRASLGGHFVLDTLRAFYVWEAPYYPQFYIPVADVSPGVLVDEGHEQRHSRGTSRSHTLRVGDVERRGAAQVYVESPIEPLRDTVRFEWSALEAWYEEDEQVFVHPRSPYVRVDALRSTRAIRVELEGLLLAESTALVMVFETGLPTRYYFDRTAVDFSRLMPSDTKTACPYKGVTTSYWSVRGQETLHRDLAWSYSFPTRALQPIAGMLAFYNEKVDTYVEGQLLARPQTHFS